MLLAMVGGLSHPAVPEIARLEAIHSRHQDQLSDFIRSFFETIARGAQITIETMKVKNNKDVWEQQYGSGTWDYLSSDSEFAHYSMVAAYVQKQRRPISLLDLGCGEGILLRYLDRDYIKQYTGVDFAQTALERIRNRHPSDEFVCASLDDYIPDRKWDVILFNEVLYFMSDPIGILEKFNGNVKEGGVVIVSMHQKKNPFCQNNRCFRQVMRYLELNRYPVLDRVQVNNGCRWDIFAYRLPEPQRN